MIDKTAVIATVLTKLKKLPIGHYLDLQTYKKDRSVVIVKKDDDDFLIIENGFHQEKFNVSFAKLKKTLKKGVAVNSIFINKNVTLN